MPARPAARAGASFPVRVHQPAVAHRSQKRWEGDIKAENPRAQIQLGERDRVARTEGDVVEDAAVLAQRDFSIGAAIEVIEDWPRKPALRQRPEIADTDDMGRRN